MKKSIAVVVLLVVCVLVLAACGGSSDPKPNNAGNTGNETAPQNAAEPPKVEFADLKGTWVSDSVYLGSKVVASIDDNYVGIFVLSEDARYKPQCVWMGTVDNNGKIEEGKSWESKSVQDAAIARSSSETFTYKEGKLSFGIGINGDTLAHGEETVFTRGEWETSRISWSDWGENAKNAKDLEIKDSGWIFKNGDVWYYIDVYNPNDDVMIFMPAYNVEVKDKNGKTVDSTRCSIFYVYPGEEIVIGGVILTGLKAAPAGVEFTTEGIMKQLYHTGEYTEIKPLQIKDVKVSGYNVSGKVANSGSASERAYMVTALAYDKDGKVVDIMAMSYSAKPESESKFQLTMHTKSLSDVKVYVAPTAW